MAAKKRAKGKSYNWIGKATARMKKRGTVGSYGHHTVKQMKRDKKKGRAIARKANFALNVRKGNRGGTRRRKRVSHR